MKRALKKVASLVNLQAVGLGYGRTFRIPIIAGTGVQLIRPDEPHLFAALRSILPRKEGAFIDVGVNIGQTLLKVRAIDPARRYVGFEANPRCCAFAGELAKVNRMADVDIFPLGLSNEAKVLTFQSDGGTGAGGSVVAEFRNAEYYARTERVFVVPGDQVLAALGLGSIACVKVDVEGGELEVLQGLENTLRSSRPFVLCEILPVYDRDTAEGRFRFARQERLLSLMKELGYAFGRIGIGGQVTLLEDIPVHSDLSQCDYLFSPLLTVP